MAQKVATARKMKSRQQTTSLSQVATVMVKPTISGKHLETLTRFFKIQNGNMGPPPPQPGPQIKIALPSATLPNLPFGHQVDRMNSMFVTAI